MVDSFHANRRVGALSQQVGAPLLKKRAMTLIILPALCAINLQEAAVLPTDCAGLVLCFSPSCMGERMRVYYSGQPCRRTPDWGLNKRDLFSQSSGL